MDGCSMHFDLADFAGLVIVAASPGLHVKNFINAIMNHKLLTMPPLEKDEGVAICSCLSSVLPFPLSKQDMLDNFEHMNGITRYLFRKGYAKQKVDESIRTTGEREIDQENCCDAKYNHGSSKCCCTCSRVMECPKRRERQNAI
jgi:hypothetical protein